MDQRYNFNQEGETMKAINRHLGLDICRQNIKVDGMKLPPYFIPVLRKCAYSIKDAKRIIEAYKESEVE